MKSVQFGKKFYNVPECWNELTLNQLLKIVPMLFGEITFRQRLKIFRILTGLPWSRFVRLHPDEIADKLYLSDFLFEKITLTKMPMKRYRGLYAPGDSFCNLRGKESAFTDAYYNGVGVTQSTLTVESIEALNSLVACLFRPKKKGYDMKLNSDGDCRVPFNANVVPYFSRKICRWPLNRKLIVYLWYTGCTNELVELNPKVFSSSGEVAIYGMWSVMRSIAKEAAHGDFSKVEEMYFPEIIMEINASINEAEKAERR